MAAGASASCYHFEDRKIHIRKRPLAILIIAFAGLLTATTGRALDAVEVGDLLDRAEALMMLGVIDQGADRALDDAEALLEQATVGLEGSHLSTSDRQQLSVELATVREDLEILTELYQERFFGIFPLARLILPTLLADEGLAVTEQLFHPPDVAAVVIATNRFLPEIGAYSHPHVVLRSTPTDRRLENVAAEVLVRDDRSTVYSRRALVAAIQPTELAAYDRGEIDELLAERLSTALDAVGLLVLTIGRPFELDDGAVRSLRGDYFLPGEVVQGSAVGATASIDVGNFQYLGFARDRRDQFWPIFLTQLVLLGLALAWASRLPWRLGTPLTMPLRLLVGTALFGFGRIFVVIAVSILSRALPDATAMVLAAWWWPALLGLLSVLGCGLVAWIGQARWTNVVPGARGERAVGSIFALSALGAGSYYVAPLLLLDETRGFATLGPFLLASIILAVLFGMAARTGPPVPYYFGLGPLLLAPLAGATLLMASPRLSWAVVGASALVVVAAWTRHRVAVARGTEEDEPLPEEAARADQERLIKLGQRITKKL